MASASVKAVWPSCASLLLLLALLACSSGSGAAGSSCKTCIKSLLVLGDSISDGGLPYGLWAVDNKTVPLERLGYYQGHFSNGPVWSDYVAYLNKLSILNVAMGGTTVNYFPNLNNLDHLVTEASLVLSQSPLPQPSVAVIFIGSNDFVYLPESLLANATALNAYLGNISTGIGAASHKLLKMGFKNIVISNLPPINLTPKVRVQGALAQAVTLSLVNFVNNDIKQMVQSLSLTRPKGTKIILWDSFGYVNRTVAHASRGVNVKDACVVADPPSSTNILSKLISTCKDPSKYLFWDTLHPTTAYHQKIASDFVKLAKRSHLL